MAQVLTRPSGLSFFPPQGGELNRAKFSRGWPAKTSKWGEWGKTSHVPVGKLLHCANSLLEIREAPSRSPEDRAVAVREDVIFVAVQRCLLFFTHLRRFRTIYFAI